MRQSCNWNGWISNINSLLFRFINFMIKMQGDLVGTFVLPMYFAGHVYGRNHGPILVSRTNMHIISLFNFLVKTEIFFLLSSLRCFPPKVLNSVSSCCLSGTIS